MALPMQLIRYIILLVFLHQYGEVFLVAMRLRALIRRDFPVRLKKLLNNFLQVALKSEGKPESARWFATVFIYFNKTGQKIVGNTKEARIKAYLKEADLLGLKQVPALIRRAKNQYMVDNNKFDGEELAEGLFQQKRHCKASLLSMILLTRDMAMKSS